MIDLKSILRSYSGLGEKRGGGLLATVVAVEGSAYRGPGARMLIDPDGGSWGYLSGGCLEGDVRERAAGMAAEQRCALVRYDMTAPEDLVWGLGMGCDGIVDVLIQRVPWKGGADQLTFIRESLEKGRRSAVALVYDASDDQLQGACLLLDESGLCRSDLPRPDLRRQLRKEAEEALQQGLTRQAQVEDPSGTSKALIDVIAPPLQLMIAGAGYDAIPLAALATALGWDVTVADHRSAMADSARFDPGARVFNFGPQEAAQRLALQAGAAAVVMTHNYSQDVQWLSWLLSSPAAYIGMLGPRARTRRIVQELQSQGLRIDPERMARIFGPVGLDIGAGSPEEIAVSILAEIRAVLSRRPGGFLRRREGPINDRTGACVVGADS